MDAAETAILELLAQRDAGKSICPSEAARVLGEPWRGHLHAVKQAALRLARAGQIDILRKGRRVEDLDAVRGVIRLRMAERK